MQAGTLDRRIRIDQKSGAVDELGQPVDDWSPLTLPIWANIKMLTGTAAIKADAATGAATASIRIRFRTDVTPGMRAVLLKYVDGQAVDTQIFDILQPLPDYAGREYTDLPCITGENNG